MSEANNVWRVDDDEIEVRHSTMTGKITVLVNGEQVQEDRMLMREKHLEFEVGDRKAVVDTSFKYGGLGAGSGLHVDGRYVEPLSK